MIINTLQKLCLLLFQKKQFGQLIYISPHSLTIMNTINAEFSFVQVWFTDQVSKALETEDNINLTTTIG